MSQQTSGAKSSRRKFLKITGSSGVVGLLSGCVGNSTSQSGDGNSTSQSNSNELDFDGQDLQVMLNVSHMATVHQKHLIPKIEKKYNLNISYESAATTAQLTQLEANPKNPPDIIVPDIGGLARAAENDWLEPMSKHTDIVTNLDKIYDRFVHYNSTGASWVVGESAPLINTDMWDSNPSTHAEVIQKSQSLGLTPFSWSIGSSLLLMAAAIATGDPFDTKNPDVDAGFQWLKENLLPNYDTTYQGVASGKQLIMNEAVDTLNPWYGYTAYDLYNNGAPVSLVRRPDPVGMGFAEAVAVPSGTNKMDAAMVYANETLSAEFQNTASEFLGMGITNKDATVAKNAKKFGAPTPNEFEKLAFPHFPVIWKNRSKWGSRWNELFSQ